MGEVTKTYAGLVGASIERLSALSDGVFAVAMTLLVVDLHHPVKETIHSEQALQVALLAMSPQLMTYFMTFLGLGIFWLGQQTQLVHFARGDRGLSWIHIGFLCAVALMPLSTRLLREFIHYRTALLCYWVNVLLLGLMLYVSWRHAVRRGLVRADTPPEAGEAIERMLIIVQLIWAAGALLSFVNPHLSIAFVILVQLFFAITPYIGRLGRS